jgi:ABC-type cobalamin/Fe3+-siderophores transport system ATPase subunit
VKVKLPVTDKEEQEILRLLKSLNKQQKQQIISAIHAIKKKPDA